METIDEKFTAKNCIKSQLNGVISDLEHMTSGNFMHHRASARLLAKCALEEVDRVVAEQRDIDIDKACGLVYNIVTGLIGYTEAAKDIAYKEFRQEMMEE